MNYPPQLMHNLIEAARGEDSVLFECYKARVMYGCEYPQGIEKKLDEIHKKCWGKVGPPWWADIIM